MKRIIRIPVTVLLLVLAFYLCVDPVILFIAKESLKRIFLNSTVSIGGCALTPHALVLSGVEIKNGDIYGFKLKKIEAAYTIPSLLSGRIRQVNLDGLTLAVRLGQKNISGFSRYLNLKGKSLFVINKLAAAKLSLDIKSADLSLNAGGSLSADLMGQSLERVDLTATSLDYRDISLRDLFLGATQSGPPGEFTLKSLKYNKLRVTDVKAGVLLTQKIFSLISISARVLDGEITGDFSASLDKLSRFMFNLECHDLSLAAIVRDFELKEKFTMEGRVSGTALLDAEGEKVNLLNGKFSVLDPGGRLSITDTKFLDDTARNTGQSMEMIVESFKDYQYNKGGLKLFMEDGSLVLDAALEGSQGARNLKILEHDFKLPL